jgi:prepilin signal peptidase PulO-like enzyme (type II secretory pathway)
MISWVTASYFIFSFFYLLYALSWGKAIGWWDFRIAINMGLLLGLNYIFLGWFLAYFLGSIIAIIYLCYQGYKKYILKKETTNKIAFWPFLPLGTFSALLFHSEILELYDSFLWAYYSMMF